MPAREWTPQGQCSGLVNGGTHFVLTPTVYTFPHSLPILDHRQPRKRQITGDRSQATVSTHQPAFLEHAPLQHRWHPYRLLPEVTNFGTEVTLISFRPIQLPLRVDAVGRHLGSTGKQQRDARVCPPPMACAHSASRQSRATPPTVLRIVAPACAVPCPYMSKSVWALWHVRVQPRAHGPDVFVFTMAHTFSFAACVPLRL